MTETQFGRKSEGLIELLLINLQKVVLKIQLQLK